MKVKVLGKRDLINRIVCFRDNRFAISLIIYTNIKNCNSNNPCPNYKYGRMNYKTGKKQTINKEVRYITINGNIKSENALVAIIPETKEEITIIQCDYDIKELHYEIRINFVNNWDAVKIIDKVIVDL